MNHNDNKILSHSTWNCKYHIVFAPKYRRKIFYESHRREIIEIVKELCRWKEVEILEGEMAVDHVHLLLMIPPKMSVSGFMGYLKGKSSLMIYQRWGAAKYQYRCREFWCRGYYVDTVTYFYGHFSCNKKFRDFLPVRCGKCSMGIAEVNGKKLLKTERNIKPNGITPFGFF